MTDTILQIGNTDVTAWIVSDNLKIEESAVYDDNTFVNVYGEERRTFSGTEINLSVDLTGVPESTASTILEACDNETVTIEYNAPLSRSVDFPRPKTTATLSYEETAQRVYDIHIDASVKVPLDGL